MPSSEAAGRLVAADDVGPVTVGDGLVPGRGRSTGVVFQHVVTAPVELVAVGRVGEPAVRRGARDWNTDV